jgi:hypothetical protein
VAGVASAGFEPCKESVMMRWTLVLLCAAGMALAAGAPPEEPTPAPEAEEAKPAPESQPTHRTLRKPEQAEILEGLLGRRDRPTPIRPQPADEEEPEGEDGFVNEEGESVLLEGTFVIERPGRFVEVEGVPRFIFLASPEDEQTRSMEILRSQLLETMERESRAGFSEFIVSAEVTRYKGKNFLLLRKVLRRTGHGNLTP